MISLDHGLCLALQDALDRKLEETGHVVGLAVGGCRHAVRAQDRRSAKGQTLILLLLVLFVDVYLLLSLDGFLIGSNRAGGSGARRSGHVEVVHRGRGRSL